MLEKSPLTLVVALLLLVISGCAGVGISDSPTTTTATPATTTAPTAVQTTETTQQTIEGKGKTFLHVTAVEESEEKRYNESAVAFQNLSAPKQTEFREARNCSCKIETTAFSFGQQQEVYQVKYNDDIYLIYVSVH